MLACNHQWPYVKRRYLAAKLKMWRENANVKQRKRNGKRRSRHDSKGIIIGNIIS